MMILFFLFLGSLLYVKKSIYQKSSYKPKFTFFLSLLLKHIQVPSGSSVLFWGTLVPFVLYCLEVIIEKTGISLFQSTNPNILEMIVTSTGIIFPLVILIIDTKSSNEKGLFSNSEVLLRHSLAYPISISLILFLIYNVKGIPQGLLEILAVTSLFFTALLLYRLLEVFLKPDVWRNAEQKLIKHKVYSSIFHIINSRINQNSSFKRFQEYKPVFETTYIGDKDTTYKVSSPRVGVVSNINWTKVKELYAELNKSEVNQHTPEEKTEQVTNKSEQDVIIRIMSHQGEHVDEVNNLLASIYFGKGVEPEEQERIGKEVLNIFSISSNTEPQYATDQIMIFLERSMFTGRNALNDKNIYLLKRLISVYYYIAKYTVDSFKYFGINYNLESVKNENWNIFSNQQEWASIEGLVQNITDLLTYMYNSDLQKDYLLVEDITILPYKLSLLAYDAKNLLFFSKSTRILLLLTKFEANSEAERVLSSFEGLLKYYIVPDMEKSHGDDLLDEIKPYFNNLLAGLAQIGCFALENDKDKLLSNFLKSFKEFKPFKYQYVDEELRRLNLFFKHQELSEVQKTELEKVESKIRLVNYIKNCKIEISISLIAYIDLLKRDSARVEFKGDKQNLDNHARVLFNSISFNLIDALNFTIRSNKREISDKWNLGFLEKMPENQAKFMELPSLIDNVQGAILIHTWEQAGMPETLEGNAFDRNEVIVFNKEIGFRKHLDKTNDLLEKVTGNKLAQQELDKFEKFLDNVINDAELKTLERLCETDLSDKVVNDDLVKFENEFKNNLRLRSSLKYEVLNENTGKGKSWGINTNVPRESYIEGESYPGTADSFASDMANSDDEFIYTLLMEDSKELEEVNELDEMIERSLKLGNELKDLVLITSRDLYSKNILSKSENFKFSYQEKIKNEKFKKADGFYLYKNVQIPVYQVFLRNKNTKRKLILANIDKLIIKFDANPFNLTKKIGETGVFVEIVDPKVNDELRENLIQQKPKWLQEFPEDLREKLVAKIVWYRAFQQGFVAAQENSILSIPIIEEDTD
jgi:hypothetical protein